MEASAALSQRPSVLDGGMSISQQLPQKPAAAEDIEPGFEHFIKEVRRYPLLRPEQEVNLGRQIRAGREAQTRLQADEYPSVELKNLDEATAVAGTQAKEHFIQANLRLIIKPAYSWFKHPLNKGHELQDVYEAGFFGLNDAVDRFDPERGYRFSTYAVPYIHGAIQYTLKHQGPLIHVPNGMQEALTRRLQSRSLERDEKINQADLQAANLALAPLKSLDEPYHRSDGDGGTLQEMTPDPNSERALQAIFDDETDTDTATAGSYSKLISILEHLLSPRYMEVVEKIAAGDDLGSTDIRYKFKLKYLFDHPAVAYAVHSGFGEEALSAIGVPSLEGRWQSRGACIDKADQYVSKDTARRTKEQMSEIRQTCGGCAVRTQCHAYVIAHHPEKGIWSGHRRDAQVKNRKNDIN